jgi:hypothetical protein
LEGSPLEARLALVAALAGTGVLLTQSAPDDARSLTSRLIQSTAYEARALSNGLAAAFGAAAAEHMDPDEDLAPTGAVAVATDADIAWGPGACELLRRLDSAADPGIPVVICADTAPELTEQWEPLFERAAMSVDVEVVRSIAAGAAKAAADAEDSGAEPPEDVPHKDSPCVPWPSQPSRSSSGAELAVWPLLNPRLSSREWPS